MKTSAAPNVSETTLAEAIALANKAISADEAIRYRLSDGCLDVETDQGWRQWFPEPDWNPQESFD